MKKIEIPEKEFRKLYSMYVLLNSFVNYSKRNKENPMWEFMLDDITNRSEEAILEYDKLYESWRNEKGLKLLDQNL